MYELTLTFWLCLQISILTIQLDTKGSNILSFNRKV